MKRRVFILSVVWLAGALTVTNAQSLLRSVIPAKQAANTPSHRIGGIAVDGAQAFSDVQIIKLSGLKERAAANPEIMMRAAARLQRAYANRGYIKAQVSISPQPKTDSAPEKQGLVDVAIEIEEGAVFLLRRLEFSGNETTRDNIVRRKVRLHEGAPFSQELLEKSVQRLNELGRFEKITAEDVKRELNEQEHFVDLLVTLKEKTKTH